METIEILKKNKKHLSKKRILKEIRERYWLQLCYTVHEQKTVSNVDEETGFLITEQWNPESISFHPSWKTNWPAFTYPAEKEHLKGLTKDEILSLAEEAIECYL